jgi:hypothetical protein
MNDARIAKIKKLLAMAEDKGATEAERESFREKATSLIIQWEIDEAQLTAAGDERLKYEKIVSERIWPSGTRTYAFEYATMGIHAAVGVGIRGAHSKTYDRKTGKFIETFVVVGFESDVARFKLLYESLERQCAVALSQWASSELQSWMSGTDKYKARRSFITGFGTRVRQRLTALREARISEHTTSSGNGAELVLVDRSAQLEKHVADLGWTMTRPRLVSSLGNRAGKIAGSQADIGQQRFGQGAGARGALGQ